MCPQIFFICPKNGKLLSNTNMRAVSERGNCIVQSFITASIGEFSKLERMAGTMV